MRSLDTAPQSDMTCIHSDCCADRGAPGSRCRGDLSTRRPPHRRRTQSAAAGCARRAPRAGSAAGSGAGRAHAIARMPCICLVCLASGGCDSAPTVQQVPHASRCVPLLACVPLPASMVRLRVRIMTAQGRAAMHAHAQLAYMTGSVLQSSARTSRMVNGVAWHVQRTHATPGSGPH